jgi:hypothetical protein
MPTMWKASCDDTMPSPVPLHSLELLLFLGIQWLVRAPVKLLGGAMWRPCNITQIHCLNGPVGQPFAFRLGGQQFVSQGCTHNHNGTGFLLLALSCYKGAFYSVPRDVLLLKRSDPLLGDILLRYVMLQYLTRTVATEEVYCTAILSGVL